MGALFDIPVNNPFVTAIDWEIDRLCRIVYDKIRYSNVARYTLEEKYLVKDTTYTAVQMAIFVGHKFAAKNYYVYVIRDDLLHSITLIVSRSSYKLELCEKLLHDLTRGEIAR